jgi:hypothetical protein
MNRILAILFTVVFVPLFSIPITWASSPVVLSLTGANASDPHVAMDTSGNLVAVWVENNMVLAKTKLVSGNWSSAATLSSATASSPRLVVDPSGNATAVWIDGGVVTAATHPFNGSWGTRTSLSGSGASNPDLAVDPSGNVVAVWTTGGIIQSATKLFNGSWPIFFDTLSLTGIPSDSAHVAIGNNGNVVAVWYGNTNSFDTIYAVSKPVTGSWGLVQVVSGEMNSINPKVAVDPNGNAVAVWYAFNAANNIYSDVTVQAASLPMNGTSEAPVILSNVLGLTNPSSLVARVAFDGSGNAIAVWNTSSDGETFTFESSVLQVNESWISPAVVASGLYAFAEDLAVDANGDALLAFMNLNGNSITVYSTEMSVAAVTPNIWASATTISSGSRNGYPRIAEKNNGNNVHAAAVWLSYNGTNTTLVALTGTGTVYLPPTNPTVVQTMTSYALFTDYINTVSWQASGQSHLAGYAVYRNGEVIAKVSTNTLQFVDHNRNPSVPDTYGIAAFGSGSEQSAIVFVTAP